MTAGDLVALAAHLGGRRLERHQPLAGGIEPRPLGQGGATVAELLDRGRQGGVPPGGMAPGGAVGAGEMTGGTGPGRVDGPATVLGGA